mgnify:CR=1 FL=1
MKKIIYLISIFISISIICKSQVICDDTNCIAIGLTDDLIKEPDKIIRKSKHKFDELKKYNKKFEVDCEWPTFYIFNKHGEKYLSHAEAVGTAVEIKNHSNTIQAKFIPITWRGEEQLVVNDFNGDAIFMDFRAEARAPKITVRRVSKSSSGPSDMPRATPLPAL